MTEENQDSTPPKLRLSRESEDPKADKNPEPTPDLKLKRPSAEPQEEKVKLKKPTPPAETGPESPAVETPSEPAFDPDNPFSGIVKEPKTEDTGRRPPELPSKPTPVRNNGSGQKVEEAIGRIGEEKKSRGLLTSFIVIFLLLAVLGASGYGLYYLLSSPSETNDSAPVSEGADLDDASNEKSSGLLSGPITKAKAAIAKIPGSGSDLDETPSAPKEALEEKVSETEKIAAPAAVELPVTADTSQAESISGFLTNAHIGGVRTGDRPKLILNGKSYNAGDLVDSSSGLRFIGLKNEKIAFRDAQGIIYIKSF